MTRVAVAGAPALPRISAAAARRIALAAQGFAEPRPVGPVTARHVRRAVARLGLLQLDSVNVFCRSHYLPLLARLGPYPRAVVDRLAAHSSVVPSARGRSGGQELVEYWAHEASLIPAATRPLLQWRMDRADEDAWGRMSRMKREFPHLVEQVFEQVRDHGPIRASATGFVRDDPRPGQMWNWHDGKVALEYLFWAGRIMAARRVTFERWYDVPERVLPAEVLATVAPPGPDAQRELVRIAARAMGVATEPDLGDYFRLPRAESKQRVAELVEAGELHPVRVDGWQAPAYLWPGSRRPHRIAARALLSPFDNLIWFRDRTQRLFDFHYRIEIYTPAARRRHGYYVLPFLLGDALVGRVDLKSDRQGGVLRVQSAFAEPDVEVPVVAEALALTLAETAAWLGLDGVLVAERGELAGPLRAALAARA